MIPAQFISSAIGCVWAMANGEAELFEAQLFSALISPPQNFFGTGIDFKSMIPRMEVVENTAVIPVRGRIMRNVPDAAAVMLGLHDIKNLEADLDSALSNRSVNRIALHIDSLGGSAAAGEEGAQMIEDAAKHKPVMAFCDNAMASAAYQIAAPSHAIYSTPYAPSIGSIGSMAVVMNKSEFYKKVGMQPTVFRSGAFKGQGEDGAISEECAAHIQSLVDGAGERFRAMVKKHRPGIAESDMQGQWFDGRDAAKRNLVQGTAKNIKNALASFSALM